MSFVKLWLSTSKCRGSAEFSCGCARLRLRVVPERSGMREMGPECSCLDTEYGQYFKLCSF
eukprot:1234415-Pleurochrysis_carterae.AAC.3